MPGRSGGRLWCRLRWSCTTHWGDWWDSTPRPLLCPPAPPEPSGAPASSRLCPATVRRNRRVCLALVQACKVWTYWLNLWRNNFRIFLIGHYQFFFICVFGIYFERSHYILIINQCTQELFQNKIVFVLIIKAWIFYYFYLSVLKIYTSKIFNTETFFNQNLKIVGPEICKNFIYVFL